jgi:dTDP-4-dehydrorhamnose 3,5-epimerase
LKFKRLSNPDLILIEPDIYFDDRGYFTEDYNKRNFDNFAGRDISFVQDNISYSKKNVARGMHYQLPPHAQGKLVSVIQGEILDIAVDIRVNSLFFSQVQTVILSEENRNKFWLPEGFAHGFIVLSDSARVMYKTTNFYNQKAECIISMKSLPIDYPTDNLIFSEKDLQAPLFDFVDYFE